MTSAAGLATLRAMQLLRLARACTIAIATIGATGVACHHDAPPVAPEPGEPGDKPPLPPASGTPIGYLIDAASDLHLDAQQVDKLRGIDDALAAELEVIDEQLRAAQKPAGESAPQPQTGRRGRRGGGMGMGGGGMGGGGMGGGGGGGGHRGKSGSGSGSGGSRVSAADLDHLSELRISDVRDAIHRALAALDPNQQDAAVKLLASHDVDLDGGRGSGSANGANSPSHLPREAAEDSDSERSYSRAPLRAPAPAPASAPEPAAAPAPPPMIPAPPPTIPPPSR